MITEIEKNIEMFDPSIRRVIFGLIKRFTGTMRSQFVWDWEDLVQEAVLGALIAIKSYNVIQGHGLDNWVYYRVRERLICLSRTGFYSPVKHCTRLLLPTELEDKKLISYDSKDISQYLNYLSTDWQRQVITLYFGLEGKRLTANEIAKQYGRKKATIEDVIRRSIKKMKHLKV